MSWHAHVSRGHSPSCAVTYSRKFKAMEGRIVFSDSKLSSGYTTCNMRRRKQAEPSQIPAPCHTVQKRPTPNVNQTRQCVRGSKVYGEEGVSACTTINAQRKCMTEQEWKLARLFIQQLPHPRVSRRWAVYVCGLGRCWSPGVESLMMFEVGGLVAAGGRRSFHN